MKRFMHIVILLALFVALASPVVAQETPVEEQPTAVEAATVTPGSIAVTVTPGGEPVLPPPTPPVDGVTVSLGTLAFLLGLTVLAGVGAGAGIGAIIFQYLGRRDVQDTAEKLFEGMSPESQKMLRDQLANAQETINKFMEFFHKVTDGQPNTDVIVAQVIKQIGQNDRANWGIDEPKGVQDS